MIQVLEKIDDKIDLISMKNDNIEVVVSNFGCTIVKVLMKDKDGNIDDVVLGYDDFSSYSTLDAYLGALVGRIANRIKRGKFSLNDKEYTLAVNNGPNHLHGGIKGFSYQVFDYEIKDENTIEFHYISKDGEEGYPGTLDFKAIYTLNDDTLNVHYLASCDQDTIINITNHSYFNLSGKKENIYNHKLTLKADKFACVDNDGLPTGEFRNVEGTPFDFNAGALIGDRVEVDYDQLIAGAGFDHPFIFSASENQAILEHKESGRRLTVTTTLPGAQIYTANYLDGRLGKYGQHYYKRDAVCIETQNLPDAIHLEEEPTTILKKGQIYDETTSYKFEVIR
ncbi:MAG: aldose epimerase family protein [Bacilli bacterium]|nr:aldose epimerase family protein [Bacilli bacterium]